MSSIIKVNTIQDAGGNSIITSDGAGNVTTPLITQGITQADMFRLSATLSNPGDVDITSNIERADDATFAKIGTGMTESSGIFSFPTTGLYQVVWTFTFLVNSSLTTNFYTSVSTDSGSTYDDVARGLAGNINGSSTYNMGTTFAFVNVTNSSTFRVKFRLNGAPASFGLTGNTAYNITHWTFIRLGDSQ